MEKPSNRNFTSFRNWINNTEPLSRKETEFVKHCDDFVALDPGEEGGWIDGILEDCLSCLPRHLAQVNIHSSCSTKAVKIFFSPVRLTSLHVVQKLLTSDEQLKKSDGAYLHLYSKTRINFLVRLTLTVISVLLLMAPTALLFLVRGHGKLKIVLVMIFTLIFGVTLGVFTKAKHHEMFAATAA